MSLQSCWEQLGLRFETTCELPEYDSVIWYDGPLAVFTTLDGQRLFGVWADEEDKDEGPCMQRWLFVAVSKEDEAHLRSGEMRMVEPFRRESVLVADVDWYKAPALMRMAPVDGRMLPEDVLPTDTARLVP